MSRYRLVALSFILALFSLSLVPLAAAQDNEEVVVRVGLHAAEKNLNPFIVPQALPLTHDFTMLVYDTLFWSQSRLDPEPWLATGAEPSEDFRTWTVTLRDDVTWHDGTPFTAADVAFTFEYFAADGGPGRYGHHVYDHPVFESASVLDDVTVQISFQDPVTTFELLPGGDVPILPKHVWEGVTDPRADATSLPIGTGPFQMVEYDPGVSYRLAANPDYFLGAPLVDTLIMPVVRDAQAAFAGLRTGELDFVTRNLPAPLVPRVQDNEELAVVTGSRMQSLYLMFNTRKPVLREPAVRKAMSMALDLQAIVDIVEGGLGRPGNDTWTHPDSPWAHPVGGHAFDIDAANTMLDEAGYPMGDGDVRRNADGAPLAFTLLVNAAAPPQIRSGELVAEQLAAIGVDITVEPLDAPAISAARRPGPDGPPTVDMFIAVFESHAHADPDHLFFFFHTPGRGVGGIFSGYANPEFDAIVEDALDAPIAEKLSLTGQAQEIFAAEAPAVVLYYPDGRWGFRPGTYDGWISDPGHGVFTKRSFLAPYAAGSAVSEENVEEADTGETPADPEPEAEADPDSRAADETESDAQVEESDTSEEESAMEEDAAATAAPDEPAAGEAATGDSDADDGDGGAVALVVAVVIVAAAVTAFIIVRRRGREGTVAD
jgi:peptide/nickel transport system substrate-binding protein